MTADADPAKRVPKSLGTDVNLIGGYALADLVVAGGPAVLVIVLTQTILPSVPTVFGVSVTAPLSLGALVGGVILVSVTPDYSGSLPWLRRIVEFQMEDSKLPHDEAKAYTRVKRLLPACNALERTDGALVGAVRVSPVSMALATEQEWARKTDAFEDFLNTSVDFPIQLYSTTQPFPVDEHLSAYQARLSDPDVESNPQLEALIEHYLDWYEADHQRRQTTIRDHYVIVAVSPREVTYDRKGVAGLLGRLDGVGQVVSAVSSPPQAEARAAMVAELDDRLNRVERGLSGIDEVDARRLHTEDLLPLLGDFWVGVGATEGNPRSRYRSTPLVRRGAQ